jgi:AraC-like DNA-binding protein
MSDWLYRIAPNLRPVSPDTGRRRYTSFEEALPTFSTATRVIYDHELILYTGSDFVIEIEGTEHSCGADTYIIIPPGKLHVEYNLGVETALRYWCHFDWDYQPDYVTTPSITYFPGKPEYHMCRYAPNWVPDRLFTGRIREPERIFDLARRLAEMWAIGSEAARLQSRHLLLELLLTLLGKTVSLDVVPERDGPLPSRIRRALDEFVMTNECSLPVPSILKDFAYSYEHLCRVFKNTYGISPLPYLNSLRVTRARSLLRSTTLSVADIGYRVGFDDPSYFGKVFGRMMQETPHKYRKRIQQLSR